MMNVNTAALVSSVAIASCLLADVTRAEEFGLMPGRGGDPSALPKTSVEIGYKPIEGGSLIGGRVNYRVDERITAFAEIGAYEGEDEIDEVTAELSGQPFGAGVFYHLPDVAETVDVSLLVSYHVADLDLEFERVAENRSTVDATEIQAGVAFGGKEPIADNGLRWIGSLTYATISSDIELDVAGNGEFFRESASDDTDGLAFSLGILLPVDAGEAYLGYESFDGEGGAALGFRYFLQ